MKMKQINPTLIAKAVITLLFSMLFSSLWAQVDAVSSNPVSYWDHDWNGSYTEGQVVKEKRFCEVYNDLNLLVEQNQSVPISMLVGKWNYVNTSLTYTSRECFDENTCFIIKDGCSLTFEKGFSIKSTASLCIYSEGEGEGEGTGRVVCTSGGNGYAAIGCDDIAEGGHLVIHGCTIGANSNQYNAAGIGGSIHPYSGLNSVTIWDGTVTAIGKGDGAGIGGQQNNLYCDVTIYGGTVNATGGIEGAGIGGGKACGNGDILIFGGNVTARCGNTAPIGIIGPSGDSKSAGIGGGASADQHGDIHIYGGTVTAFGNVGIGAVKKGGTIVIEKGTVDAVGLTNSGIGSGDGDEIVTINGGSVNARSANQGAGIGHSAGGGTITINGGTVVARGGAQVGAQKAGAGIGGGYMANGGNVVINGGNVEAYGGTGIYARHTGNGFSKTYIGAAGIGGGYKGNGGTVAINGGRVMVEIGFSDSRYIGHGGDVADNGTLTLAPGIKVHYYPYCSPVASSSRVSTCQGRCDTWGSDRPEYKDLVIETCDHPDGLTYTINDTHHTSHCKYCLYSLTEEHHIPQVTNVCDECGYGEEVTRYSVGVFMVRNVDEGVIYEGSNYQTVADKPYTLPECRNIPEGYEFAGWLAVDNANAPEGFEAREGEILYSEGFDYTPTGDILFFARYKRLVVQLQGHGEPGGNERIISKYQGMKTTSVELAGLTLYKDGAWNTLCLPFSLNSLDGTPLEGAIVKTLVNAEFADGTLTLDFSDNLSGIDAGVPYIVKWESGADNVSSPQFQGVTLSARNIPITFDNIVSFQGIYSTMNTKDEYNTSGANNTILYLGSDNVLYYPIEEMEINAFHAYFQLLGDLVCGEPTPTDTAVNASVLHFGDKNPSGIIAIDHPTSHNHHSGWYELSGRRLSGKPKAKGLYIKDGKKVIVK